MTNYVIELSHEMASLVAGVLHENLVSLHSPLLLVSLVSLLVLMRVFADFVLLLGTGDDSRWVPSCSEGQQFHVGLLLLCN